MRLLGTRRAAVVAGVATVAAVALTGCSAGQVAETALKRPSVPGVNATTADGSVTVRNLSIAYPGPQGYPAGSSAPIEVTMSNETSAEIVVNVSTRPPENAAPEAGVVSGRLVGLVGGESAQPSPAQPSVAPEPSGSRPAATPDSDTPDNVEPSAGAPSVPVQPSVSPAPEAGAQPARITIPAYGSVSFLPGDEQQLQVFGLTARALPAMAVNLVFEFSNGAPALVLQAPVAVPLSPAPREPGVDAGLHESDEGAGEGQSVSEGNTGEGGNTGGGESGEGSTGD